MTATTSVLLVDLQLFELLAYFVLDTNFGRGHHDDVKIQSFSQAPQLVSRAAALKDFATCCCGGVGRCFCTHGLVWSCWRSDIMFRLITYDVLLLI